MGQKIGVLGKEGAQRRLVAPALRHRRAAAQRQYGISEAYAFFWQAYQAQYQPQLQAVARPHHLAWAGDDVVLDGSLSWSAKGPEAHRRVTNGCLSDGRKADGPKVTQRYPYAGEYSEILKVTDAEGRVHYDFAVVVVFDREHPEFLPPAIHAVYLADVRSEGRRRGHVQRFARSASAARRAPSVGTLATAPGGGSAIRACGSITRRRRARSNTPRTVMPSRRTVTPSPGAITWFSFRGPYKRGEDSHGGVARPHRAVMLRGSAQFAIFAMLKHNLRHFTTSRRLWPDRAVAWRGLPSRPPTPAATTFCMASATAFGSSPTSLAGDLHRRVRRRVAKGRIAQAVAAARSNVVAEGIRVKMSSASRFSLFRRATSIALSNMASFVSSAFVSLHQGISSCRAMRI